MTKETSVHEYAVLDGYRYMLRTVNEGSKTSIKIHDIGRFKYFLYLMNLRLGDLICAYEKSPSH